MAEWLGRALQKLVQRFESARDLKKPLSINVKGFLFGLAPHFATKSYAKKESCPTLSIQKKKCATTLAVTSLPAAINKKAILIVENLCVFSFDRF